MASRALHLKSQSHKTLFISSPQTLTFPHLFSSSSSSDNNGGDSSKPFSSRFADIKSRLKQHEQQQNPSTVASIPFKFTTPSHKAASLEEIRKNLSEFRLRSSPQQQPPSLQDLYKKNIPNPNANTPNGIRDSMRQGSSGSPSFEVIQESLRQMRDKGDRPKTGVSPNRSFTQYMENFKIRPESGGTGSKVYGGSTEGLPISVFGKEMSEREKKKKGGKEGESAEDEFAKAELIRPYSHPELGEKLRELRGESDKGEKEKSGFSLKELNERLKKLREIEENKQVGSGMGFSHGELRSGLQQILLSRDANSRKPDFPRIDILSQMDGTRAFLLHPPKEQLIEKYFHPDNMSSEEKLKLELKKVRDEFKMHESDCGSARVQIAQLTTEISHLSSVLHKKDKHSRKGLLGKVQQRKKLLKYLRRTDWDSYCFVLSKLGLRDNPDYKH